MILELPGPSQVRSELLAVAMMVGTRYFAREVLLELFHEEMQMLKEASIIQDWIDEGEARGRAKGIRRLVLRLLRERFGEVPASLISRVERESVEWCEELAVRTLTASSLQDLGL